MTHETQSDDTPAAEPFRMVMPGNIAELAATCPVRRPPAEPLPGVFASCALETVYLIRCGRCSVLVDTGFVHNFAAHLDNFAAAGHDLSAIAAVLTTHFHVDHTGALADARARLGCPIVAHRNNVAVFESGDPVASAAQVPYAGWDFPFQACAVDHAVEDGDTIEVDGTEFRVVHLPGHTPGCTGYLFGDGLLILGDVVFPGGFLGWNDAHWGSNCYDVLDTMDYLARLAPKVCLPSHGLPWQWDGGATSAAAIRRVQVMLDEGIAAGMSATHRAPRAEANRTPRTIRL
jgi:glyoxylase-like metal-dependent hydrolase (beta-lactamase superfamily II)